MAEKDEKNLLVATKNLLAREMMGFSNAMNPVEIIERATAELEVELGVANRQVQARALVPMPESEGIVFPENSITRTIQFCKEKHGVEPFLIYFTDTKKSLLYSRHEIFKSESKEYSEGQIKQYFMDSMYKLLTSPHTKSASQVHRAFNQYLSAFSNPPPYPGKCEYFYSLKFGNQKSFNLFNLFQNPSKSPSLYYMCFNETDMNLEKIRSKSLVSEVTEAKRKFVQVKNKENMNLPFFSLDSGHLTYYHDYPVDFFTAVRNNLSLNPENDGKLLKLMEDTCLAVQIPEHMLKSKYHRQIKYLQWTIWSLILIFISLYLRLKMQTKPFKLGLSVKIKLAISFMVFIPIIGFIVIADIINQENHSIEVYGCQLEMNLNAKLIEQIFSSSDLRLMATALNFKKEFSEIIKLNKNKNRIAALPEIPYFEGLEWLDNIKILTSDLRSYMIPGIIYKNFAKSPLHVKNTYDMLGYFQIIQNMDLLAKQNRRVEAEVAKLDLALGGTSNFWSSMAPRYRLSLESYISKPITDIETVKRAIFHLISSKDNPMLPKLITTTRFWSRGLITHLYLNFIGENLSLFETNNLNYRIQAGLFFTDGLKVYPNTLKHISNNESLYNIARLAFKNKSTISTNTSQNGKTHLQYASYQGYSPFVVASEAVIEKTDLKSTVYIIIALLLLIYCICSIALLSDVIGVVFLAPIKTFLNFVEGVEGGNLNIETQVDTRNELKELSLSLNHMSKGLLEREKMRRFVSDKLYESLEEEKAVKGRTKVSILFSDIRSFTQISETYPPEEIVAMLNDYFTLMESAISKYNGSIEKIIGDAILATFYEDTEANEHHSVRSCKAALLMKTKLKEFNKKRIETGGFAIENGIGISTGEVYLGFAGKNARRREFLLVGEPVKKC